jgi:hypothetical protein
MLRSQRRTHVKMDKRAFEYPLVDAFKGLVNKEVRFVLHWEHMPVIGPILKNEIELGNYTLPDKMTQTPGKYIVRREIDYEDEE